MQFPLMGNLCSGTPCWHRHWANLRASLQTEALPTQSIFLLSLLSQVLSQALQSEYLPSYSCTLSSLSFTGAFCTSNSILPSAELVQLMSMQQRREFEESDQAVLNARERLWRRETEKFHQICHSEVRANPSIEVHRPSSAFVSS